MDSCLPHSLHWISPVPPLPVLNRGVFCFRFPVCTSPFRLLLLGLCRTPPCFCTTSPGCGLIYLPACFSPPASTALYVFRYRRSCVLPRSSTLDATRLHATCHTQVLRTCGFTHLPRVCLPFVTAAHLAFTSTHAGVPTRCRTFLPVTVAPARTLPPAHCAWMPPFYRAAAPCIPLPAFLLLLPFSTAPHLPRALPVTLLRSRWFTACLLPACPVARRFLQFPPTAPFHSACTHLRFLPPLRATDAVSATWLPLRIPLLPVFCRSSRPAAVCVHHSRAYYSKPWTCGGPTRYHSAFTTLLCVDFLAYALSDYMEPVSWVLVQISLPHHVVHHRSTIDSPHSFTVGRPPPHTYRFTLPTHYRHTVGRCFRFRYSWYRYVCVTVLHYHDTVTEFSTRCFCHHHHYLKFYCILPYRLLPERWFCLEFVAFVVIVRSGECRWNTPFTVPVLFWCYLSPFVSAVTTAFTFLSTPLNSVRFSLPFHVLNLFYLPHYFLLTLFWIYLIFFTFAAITFSDSDHLLFVIHILQLFFYWIHRWVYLLPILGQCSIQFSRSVQTTRFPFTIFVTYHAFLFQTFVTLPLLDSFCTFTHVLLVLFLHSALFTTDLLPFVTTAITVHTLPRLRWHSPLHRCTLRWICSLPPPLRSFWSTWIAFDRFYYRSAIPLHCDFADSTVYRLLPFCHPSVDAFSLEFSPATLTRSVLGHLPFLHLLTFYHYPAIPLFLLHLRFVFRSTTTTTIHTIVHISIIPVRSLPFTLPSFLLIMHLRLFPLDAISRVPFTVLHFLVVTTGILRFIDLPSTVHSDAIQFVVLPFILRFVLIFHYVGYILPGSQWTLPRSTRCWYFLFLTIPVLYHVVHRFGPFNIHVPELHLFHSVVLIPFILVDIYSATSFTCSFLPILSHHSISFVQCSFDVLIVVLVTRFILQSIVLFSQFDLVPFHTIPRWVFCYTGTIVLVSIRFVAIVRSTTFLCGAAPLPVTCFAVLHYGALTVVAFGDCDTALLQVVPLPYDRFAFYHYISCCLHLGVSRSRPLPLLILQPVFLPFLATRSHHPFYVSTYTLRSCHRSIRCDFVVCSHLQFCLFVHRVTPHILLRSGRAVGDSLPFHSCHYYQCHHTTTYRYISRLLFCSEFRYISSTCSTVRFVCSWVTAVRCINTLRCSITPPVRIFWNGDFVVVCFVGLHFVLHTVSTTTDFYVPRPTAIRPGLLPALRHSGAVTLEFYATITCSELTLRFVVLRFLTVTILSLLRFYITLLRYYSLFLHHLGTFSGYDIPTVHTVITITVTVRFYTISVLLRYISFYVAHCCDDVTPFVHRSANTFVVWKHSVTFYLFVYSVTFWCHFGTFRAWFIDEPFRVVILPAFRCLHFDCCIRDFTCSVFSIFVTTPFVTFTTYHLIRFLRYGHSILPLLFCVLRLPFRCFVTWWISCHLHSAPLPLFLLIVLVDFHSWVPVLRPSALFYVAGVSAVPRFTWIFHIVRYLFHFVVPLPLSRLVTFLLCLVRSTLPVRSRFRLTCHCC